MKSSFQTIILIIFGVAFMVAVAVFSGIFSSGKRQASTPIGIVKIWGVLPQEETNRFVRGFNGKDLGYTLEYKEISPESFTQTLIVALADGKQPDMVLISSELFSRFRDKLSIIPYSQYPERTFRDANVDGAQVFLLKDGVVVLPLLVDPLVVYYNKDLTAGARLVTPPTTWAEMTSLVPSFTKRDSRGNITQSTIALGEGENVLHLRDILSTMFLQAGNDIVEYDRKTGVRTASIGDRNAEDALIFFTTFSNPTDTHYSWNRSLPSSRSMFLSGRLAFYIGRASELFTIQSQNPNLNFDVMEMFQPENAVQPITFGSFIGVSVLKAAPNKAAAMAALGAIATDSSVDELSKRLAIPPAKKSLLRVQELDPYVMIFYRAALSARAWPDPNNTTTEEIFRDMIQDITSGTTDAGGAINEANSNIQSNIR